MERKTKKSKMTEDENLTPYEPYELAVKNLEANTFLLSAGINAIRSQRGTFGDLAYDKAENADSDLLLSNEANEIRKQLREQGKSLREKLGYAGPYSGPTDSDISFQMYIIGRESLQAVKIGDLEKILKEKGAQIEFEVPEKLRNFSKKDILEKAQEAKIEPENLSEEYKDALKMQEILTQAYNVLGAQKIMEKINFYGGINQIGAEIAKKYTPKPSEETK